MFFDNWWEILRIIVVGTGAYISILLFHRLSGKRTLSKLNAFDLVVTVSLGSTIANALLSSSVTIVEAATALGLLVGLQFAVTWLSVRIPAFSRVIKSEPRLLVREGRMLRGAMRDERVVPAEIEQAVRTSGQGGVEQVAAVILETDGTLSVISDSAAERSRGGPSAFDSIVGD